MSEPFSETLSGMHWLLRGSVMHNQAPMSVRTQHDWLRKIRLASVPGPQTPLLGEFHARLLERFHHHRHQVEPQPGPQSELLLTSAVFNQPLPWRQALLFTARARYGIQRPPVILTLLHAGRAEFSDLVEHFQAALAANPLNQADFSFPGLAPQSWRVLIEQGRRGGALLSLLRLLQAQTKSIRLLLIIGDDQIEGAFHFDLVGSHRYVAASNLQTFLDDCVLRAVTALSTEEITRHLVDDPPIAAAQWAQLSTPSAMAHAGRVFGERGFFTEMIRISDLVQVPAIERSMASQYSEGCFATWDPQLGALIATVTGSRRPVDKSRITDDDLAVISGVRPDLSGALIRHVAGLRNDPPSSEAVELYDMDAALPRVRLDGAAASSEAPVLRSKLHGHRGVSVFDPALVEHVPLDPAYYDYPVSCATDAQARAIKAAFARAEALRDPEDPRRLVFTVLPGHGVLIAETWVPGKLPFEIIWETIDRQQLVIDKDIPQGMLRYLPGSDGKLHLDLPADR